MSFAPPARLSLPKVDMMVLPPACCRRCHDKRLWSRIAPLILCCSLNIVIGGHAILAQGPTVSRTRKVDFNREVRPILAKNCFACHGQDESEAGQGAAARPPRVGRRAAQERRDGDRAAAIRNRASLLRRITDEDETMRMPPRKAGNRLTPAEVNVLKRGSSKEPNTRRTGRGSLRRPLPLPEVSDPAWPRNGIDLWILARLDEEGIKPRPRPTGFIVLRRVSLDLRGLPPTPEEVERFMRRHGPRCLRAGRRSVARRPGLRRALGADVARPGSLCRLGRLRLRPAPPQHLALSRLGHRRLQPQPAVRPVHDSSKSPATCCPIRRSTSGSRPPSTATR